MPKAVLLALALATVSTAAAGDEIEEREAKWLACVEAQAVAYAGLQETAAEAARLAAVKCRIHKVSYALLLAPPDSPFTDLDAKRWANQMADQTESWIINRAAVDVLDTRLKASQKP